MLIAELAHSDGEVLLECLIWGIVVGLVIAVVCAAIRAAGSDTFTLRGWPGWVGLALGSLWTLLCIV